MMISKFKIQLVFLLILLPLRSFSEDIKIYDIRTCTKQKRCLEATLAPNTDIVLIALDNEKLCNVKTGKNFVFESKAVPGDDDMYSGEKNKFEATEILSKNCDLAKFNKATSSKVSSYHLYKVKVVDDQSVWKRLDSILRKSEAFAPERSLIGGLKIRELNLSIGLVHEIQYEKMKVFSISYSAKKKDGKDYGYGFVVNALAIGDKVFELPSAGHPNFKQMWAYELNGSPILETSSSCGECDTWSGVEVFELLKGSPKLIHTTYDLLPVPE